MKKYNARLKSATAQLTSRLNGLVRQLDDFDARTRRLANRRGPDRRPSRRHGRPGRQGQSRSDGEGPPAGFPLEALESQFAKRSTIVSSTPSVAPVRGVVNSGFGSRLDPFTGEGAFHQGLDISARRDEPVLATAAGVVVRSGLSGDYGKSVEIAHRAGYKTIYGHLDTILVQEGQQLRRGDRLGLAGSSGRSTGNHLHYEVRRGDRAVNPLEYILDTR